MTDSHLMAADCIHGVVWFECAECAKDDPRPPDEPPFSSPFYKRCDDPACPLAYAYKSTVRDHTEHFHYIGGPVADDRTIAERHQQHYRSCDCLADAAECCVTDCPCHLAVDLTIPGYDNDDQIRRMALSEQQLHDPEASGPRLRSLRALSLHPAPLLSP